MYLSEHNVDKGHISFKSLKCEVDRNLELPRERLGGGETCTFGCLLFAHLYWELVHTIVFVSNECRWYFVIFYTNDICVRMEIFTALKNLKQRSFIIDALLWIYFQKFYFKNSNQLYFFQELKWNIIWRL